MASNFETDNKKCIQTVFYDQWWSTLEPCVVKMCILEFVQNGIIDVDVIHCADKQTFGSDIKVSADIDGCLESKSVLKVGVTETRYVSLKYCRPWVIHASRNIRGRGLHKEEDFDGEPLGEEVNGSKRIKLGDDASTVSADEQGSGKGTLPISDQHTNRTPDNNHSGIVEQKTLESEKLPQTSISSTEGVENKHEMDTCASVITESENAAPVPGSSSQGKAIDLSSGKDYTERKSAKDSEDGKSVTSAADADSTDNVQRSQSKMATGSQIDEPSTSSETRSTRKRKHSVDEDVSENKEPPAKSSYDKVRLVCQPWRKPEGGVNKPVLKMILESVMLFLMTKPAANIKTLYARYSPYLQPMVLNNILEILEDLGCLTRQYIKPAKVSLFSKPFQSTIATEDSEGYEILLLPTMECTFRLGQFIQEICPGVQWPEWKTFL